MKKSVLIYILTIVLVLTTGCSKIDKIYNSDIDFSKDDSSSFVEPPVTTIEEIEAEVPTIEKVDYSEKLEAELAEIAGELKISKTRKGYSGTGYVTNFTTKPENRFELTFDVPSNQHYNITIVVASDTKQNNMLTLNGNDVSEFVTFEKKEFQAITIRNVYMSKGNNVIGIREFTGGIDVDYIEVKNSTDIVANTNFRDSVPVNKAADEKTKNTMQYLAENYNKNVISGQYATIGTNRELELIYKTTGKYPAMRLGDMMPYTSNSMKNVKEIEEAIKWSQKGGLVSYVWHWEAPLNEPSFYAKETSFDLSKAVSKINIAQLSIEEIEKLYDKGEISKECVAIVKDIDTISKQLSILQENDVTVLWRPLHEASGGWFWWGSAGKDAYQWLWKLMFERQTYYHKLNNLIWVWNCHDATWYVGDDKCDIISADIYTEEQIPSSHVNIFLNYSKISTNKMVALSECDTPPVINYMLRDQAMWSWFGVWSGEYIMNKNGELSEEYTSKEQLINTYNHKNVITLDKLPDLNVWVS